MSLKDISRIDYVVLLCSTLQGTRHFYEKVMGFTIAEDRANWVSFRIGNRLLTLRPRGIVRDWQDGERDPGSAAVQLAFQVPLASFEGCYVELQENGVPILRPPTDLPDWRHRTLFFKDPEDNILEIYAEY